MRTIAMVHNALLAWRFAPRSVQALDFFERSASCKAAHTSAAWPWTMPGPQSCVSASPARGELFKPAPDGAFAERLVCAHLVNAQALGFGFWVLGFGYLDDLQFEVGIK